MVGPPGDLPDRPGAPGRARAPAGRGSFAAAPVAVQDALLAAGGEPLVSRLVDVALVHALEATLGPPEYGGNHAARGLAPAELAGRPPAGRLLARAGDDPRPARPARPAGDAPRARRGRCARSAPARRPAGRRAALVGGAPGARAVSAAHREPVIVVGSGAGGAVSAWALRARRPPRADPREGPQPAARLGGDGPVRTTFSNDEVKKARFYEDQDPLLEPRTQRTQAQARRGVARSFVGDVNDLPTTVGGGTVHWDAKVPRFWRQDFQAARCTGRSTGANVADWPLSYDDLAPYYDEVERHLGVQGDRARMPARTLAQAPRRHALRDGAEPADVSPGRCSPTRPRRLGYHAYPFPMAVNSRAHLGRPACNSCGFCSGFGCPIHARGGAAVSFLHHALQHGAELRSRCFVDRVETTRDGRRARGVAYRDPDGRRRRARADIVVLAPSAIETARLLLLSRTAAHPHGLGNRSGQVGRNLMFHYFTAGIGFFAERVHAWRGPSTTFTLDDFVGPVTGADARAPRPALPQGRDLRGRRRHAAARRGAAAGRGGFRGAALTSALRDLALRDHIAGIQLVGEDLPQEANRVDLDPEIRDLHGLPVPRITHSPHAFERAASAYFAPKLQRDLRARRARPADRHAQRPARRARAGQRLLRPVRDGAHHGHRADGPRPARLGRRRVRARPRRRGAADRRRQRVRLLRARQPDAHADGARAALRAARRPLTPAALSAAGRQSGAARAA